MTEDLSVNLVKNKARSKAEMYRIIARECEVYLLPIHQVN